MRRIKRNDTVLVIIDVQEKLAPVISGIEEVTLNIQRLIRGTHALAIPALLTEQYVKGLGGTVPALREALEATHGYSPIEKMCFSSLGCEDFADSLATLDRENVLLAGIEAHVCVFQTALDLLDRGFEVQIVADAVSSRTERNRDIALQRIVSEGAKLTTTEMALFELTVTSGTDEFRAISKLVK
jgi:nicotinamidase-related amidase